MSAGESLAGVDQVFRGGLKHPGTPLNRLEHPMFSGVFTCFA